MEHILLQYPFAWQVWFICFQELRIQASVPQAESLLETWWEEERLRCPEKERRNLDNLVCLVCWSLWKNRNPWVFGNTDKQYTAVRLAARVLDEINL